ncbi:hypothetical protein DRH27_05650 [Candidatus Falkowbacteria bacterium]|nr:MAG: hypothetical protein DRH27_05650 [Candidatus Falkowbacteria bacterium]
MRYLAIFFMLFALLPAQANSLADSDLDGVPDIDEENIYYTNPEKRDTDGDGYSDYIELNSGFSPLNADPIKLENCDTDSDGLSDRMELNFHTNLTNKDSDNDGHDDGVEINNGYDPLDNSGAKLEKRIEINLGAQELSYFLGGVRMDSFSVSSGKTGMYTPIGHYKVDGKSIRAWSSYGLWMPYWMSLQNGYFGIHELPEWPDGTKEGENHLGKPVSHGCIRLGVGPAEFLYNWTPVGTGVFIY